MWNVAGTGNGNDIFGTAQVYDFGMKTILLIFVAIV
jgi:hypothetical protein